MADRSGISRERHWQATGIAVFAVAALLLVSMGGAIVAAPITVPLLFLVSRRHPTGTFRFAAAVLGSLTVAEVVWALTYLVVADVPPWIWACPLAGGTAAAAVFGGGLGLRRCPTSTTRSAGRP